MKPKHTPGPWRVIDRGPTPHVRNPDFARFWVGTQPEYTTPICEVRLDGVQHDGLQVIEKLDHEANARLIAASPCLLEAAKALLDSLEHDPQYGCFDGFGRRDQANTREFFNRPEIRALVRAINKAEGEE